MIKGLKLFATFLEKLSSKPKIGGLQLGDSAIQYVLLEKGEPVSFSIKLPPGVVRDGRVLQPEEFSIILKDFQRLVARGDLKKRFAVVVSLPPALIYTQSFNVPKINEEKLAEAASLNLQIISPIDVSRAIMSYQVIGETEDRYDLLGSFVEKEAVLKFRDLLSAQGFDGLIFEFPSLGLTRAVKTSVNLPKEPVILLQVSSDGMNFSILRNNALYFEYFHSWRALQGENREITLTAFEEAVTSEVKRVIDFSLGRFKENINRVFIVAPGFEKELEKILESRFGLKAEPLLLRSSPLTSSWYSVLGSAIRGRSYSDRDSDINLSGEKLIRIFYEERVFSFLRLWRNVAVASGVILLFVFGASALLFARQANIAKARLGAFEARVPQAELTQFQEKVREFNYLVAALKKSKISSRNPYEIIRRLKRMADENNIIIDGFSIGTVGEVTLVGRAPSTAEVIRFKNILVGESDFLNVNLPLAAITTLDDNSLRFNVAFKLR